MSDRQCDTGSACRFLSKCWNLVIRLRCVVFWASGRRQLFVSVPQLQFVWIYNDQTCGLRRLIWRHRQRLFFGEGEQRPRCQWHWCVSIFKTGHGIFPTVKNTIEVLTRMRLDQLIHPDSLQIFKVSLRFNFWLNQVVSKPLTQGIRKYCVNWALHNYKKNFISNRLW